MNKKIIIPIVACIIVIIIIVKACCGGPDKIVLDWEPVKVQNHTKGQFDLKVYVENSGSMDAYMCPGSNLKAAVFDYVSDIKKYANSCSLFYINSKVIPYSGDLNTYIKDLTPQSFASAGGDRGNTDLREIFSNIMKSQKKNTVTVFVSDCILDIPESATDFFDLCQVSIKNTFNDALAKNPNLGVIIMKLDSKFDGEWYCGKNSEKLHNVKRPYYIWVIGDKEYLAQLNKDVPVSNIIGGIKNYCAYSTPTKIPFDINQKTYVVNHSNKICVDILVNLNQSLQEEALLQNVAQYTSSNPSQTTVASVQKITANGSLYSHVITLDISSPETVKSEKLTFSYPTLAAWVEASNDATGVDVKHNMDKTTGISSLIKGVSDAYKSSTEFGSVTFDLNNK